MKIAKINANHYPNFTCTKSKKHSKRERIATLGTHEQYAKLAKDSANDYVCENLGNFERIRTFQNANSGFSASIYENIHDKEIVISYRCTNNREGVKSDIQMIESKIPEQYYDAILLFEKIKKHFPNHKITLTGHSLGASLAQLVASTVEATEAITFDAFGTKSIIKKHSNTFHDYKNCTNYTTKGSIVSSVTPHPGKTYTLCAHKIEENKGKLFAPKEKAITEHKHSIDNFTNLKGAKFSNEFLANETRKMNNADLIPFVSTFLKLTKLENVIASLFFKPTKTNPSACEYYA